VYLNFKPKHLTSGGNNVNDFPEKQLTKNTVWTTMTMERHFQLSVVERQFQVVERQVVKRQTQVPFPLNLITGYG